MPMPMPSPGPAMPAPQARSDDAGLQDLRTPAVQEPIPPCYGMADLLQDQAVLGRLATAEPWGDAALTLDIPGGPYAFTGLDGATQAEALARFAPAVGVAPEVRPGAILTWVRRVEPEVFRPVADPLWSYELALSSRRDGIDLAGWRLVARLGIADGFRGLLGVGRAADLIGMGDLENYLRFLVAYRLLTQGGLLLHSACVAHRGDAYLFIGRSGAGKTTLSTLALEAGLEVLSDDMNALAPGNPPLVHKLPFAGTLGQRITASGVYPLRAICRLRKGEDLRCEPTRPTQAIARLAACAPYVNADPYRAGQLLESLEGLVAKIPVLTLTFPLGADVLSVIEQIGAQAPRGISNG